MPSTRSPLAEVDWIEVDRPTPAEVAGVAMTPRWMQVDAAAAYMGGVSRKTVYAAVRDGLRVARIGDSHPRRDSRDRLWQGRMLFCSQWIDEYLEARSTSHINRETGSQPGD